MREIYRFKIQFIAFGNPITFKFKTPNEREYNEFRYNLIRIFLENEEEEFPTLQALHQYTPEIKEQLERFINYFKDVLPQLNALTAFLGKLENNEHFYFLPDIDLKVIDSLKIKDILSALKEGKTYESPGLAEQRLGTLVSKYQIGFFGNQLVRIGEEKKSKRKCRFCGRSQPQTTFKNKAHAISEGLGNKTVILFDECDECNIQFSRTIEPDLIESLSLFRTFFDIKGKRGSKKFKGENFETRYDKHPHIDLLNGSTPQKGIDEYIIPLKGGKPLTYQNAYKSLCKFFLSVIPGHELHNFANTIDWVKGTYMNEKLPKIAEAISNQSFSKQPSLTYYIRSDGDSKVPYAVGEFVFACKVMVFIIPFSSGDDKDFVDQEDYSTFWKTFNHLHDKSEGWQFTDYSRSKPVRHNINLKVEINNTPPFTT